MTLEDELASAAARGKTAEVEKLLRAGADVNGVNSHGRTPLQVCGHHTTQLFVFIIFYSGQRNPYEYKIPPLKKKI